MAASPELPTIVTAADAVYWRSLYQFLLGVERCRHFAQCHFVVFDLGLKPEQLARLKRNFPACEYRRFCFEQYPAHVGLAANSYAWKPIIIAEIAIERGGLVLWLDSATLIKTRDLDPIWSRIRRDGVLALKGQSTLKEHCDPLTLDALEVPAELRNRPEIVAGVVGLNIEMPCVYQLVTAWRHHALTAGHIAPRQPRLALHKPEQALLSILLYRSEGHGGVRLGNDEIDISSRRPVRWMSSRNKVAPWMPLWADPAVRFYYWSYKTIDRSLWRIDHFRKGFVPGVRR